MRLKRSLPPRAKVTARAPVALLLMMPLLLVLLLVLLLLVLLVLSLVLLLLLLLLLAVVVVSFGRTMLDDGWRESPPKSHSESRTALRIGIVTT